MKRGDRVHIPVAEMEFIVGGNTIWIHSPQGATVLRLQIPTGSEITVRRGCQNPVSHVDLRSVGDVEICVAKGVRVKHSSSREAK